MLDLHAALMQVPMAVVVTRGPDHAVELRNPLAEEVLAASDETSLLDRVYSTGLPHLQVERPVMSKLDGRQVERFFNVGYEPIRDAAGLVIGVLTYGVEVTQQVRARRRLSFLVSTGPALLEASLERSDVLEEVARIAVPDLGDLCVVDLLQSDGSLRREAVAHRDAPRVELEEALRRFGPAMAQRWEQLEMLGDTGAASAMITPLRARGRVLGTLSVASAEPDRYTRDDLALLEALATRAGLALDAAALHEAEREARDAADHARARCSGLLSVTTALSRALTPSEIGEAVIAQGVALLGADAAAVFLQSDTPDELELLRATGWPVEALERCHTIRLDDGTPLADAVLSKEPVWLESRDEWALRYPRSAPVHGGGEYSAGAVIPLVIEGRRLGGLVFSFARALEFSWDDRAYLLALAGQCAQALDRARLYEAERQARTRAERQRDREAFLAEASLALDAALSQDERLQRLADLAVPRVADWCAVHVVRGGAVQTLAVTHVQPEKVLLAWELVRRYLPDPDATHGAVNVIRTGSPELHEQISDATLVALARDEEHLASLRDLGMTSAMVVPLRVRDRSVGALTLVTGGTRERFSPEDLAFAEELARHAALAVDNARLYEEQRNIARTLQESLLPHALPRIPGVTAAARYLAAGTGNTVGGDFYDVFASGDAWSVVIADVCGKGAPAATLTALVRYTVQAEAAHDPRPTVVLSRLNQAILRHMEHLEGRFCTALYGRIFPVDEGVRVTLAAAGHPPPLMVRRCGTVETIPAFGTMLGVYEDPKLHDVEVLLGSGDTLVLYTDGVTEARGPEGFFGERRLEAFLASHAGRPADELAERLAADLLAFQEGLPRDDIAILILQVAQ